jgi:hypothetical protein
MKMFEKILKKKILFQPYLPCQNTEIRALLIEQFEVSVNETSFQMFTVFRDNLVGLRTPYLYPILQSLVFSLIVFTLSDS